MVTSFNESFNDRGDKPQFIYRPNPLIPRSYQIFEFQEAKNAYEPVGEYTVLDASEDPDITEKKMMNLMALMNGKERNIINFKNLTKQRILFNMVPETSPTDHQKIIFRTYDGRGVSKENAVLTIEKGVFHAHQQTS